MKIRCPQCGQKLNIPDSAAGREGRCPKCGNVLTIPPPDAIPADLQRSSPKSDHETAEVQPHAESPAVQPSSQTGHDLLAGYRHTTRSSAGRIQAATAKVKKRARALKLKRQVRSLQAAIESQWEQMGMLVLQHGGAGLGVETQLAEIGRIQQEIAGKQPTIESLKQTKGSGSVVKELKTEIADLNARQRELVTALGQVADKQKPDMPGGAGHYSAVDRVRESLEKAKSELEVLEAELGPMPGDAKAGLHGLVKPLIGVAAAAVIVLGVWALWTFVLSGLLGGGGLGPYAYLVPRRAALVGRIDIERLMDSDLGGDLKKLSRRMIARSGGADALDLDEDDVKDVFFTAVEDDSPIIVGFRTKEDVELDDLVRKIPMDGRKTHCDIEYAFSSGRCAARMARRTYCASIFGDMDDAQQCMESAITRWTNKEEELDEEMGEILKQVDGYHHFVVYDARFTRDRRDSDAPAAGGVGFSIGSSIDARVVLKFDGADEAKDFAEKCTEGLEEAIEEGQEEVRDTDDKDEAEGFRIVLDIMEKIRISQSGDTVVITGSARIKDIKRACDLMDLDMDDQIEEMIEELPRLM